MTTELKGIHAKTFQDLDVIKDVLKLDEEKIAELEKENAELKVSCKIQVDTAFQMIYEKDNQLTKAKEIIKELYEGLDKLYLSGLSDKQIAFIERLQDKAEQFLSEVEK